MGRQRWIVTLATAILVASGCKEQDAVDLSTPKAAALTFTRALEAGDLATARRASNAAGYEGELLEAMTESSSGMARLTAVASEKLGDEARRIAQEHASISMTKVLAEATVDVKGNRATVMPKEGGSIQLLRIDGIWRVDVGALGKGQDLTQVTQFLRAAGLAARQISDDIDAGRLTSIEDVQGAMMGRVLANLPQRLRGRLLPPPRTSGAPAATPGS